MHDLLEGVVPVAIQVLKELPKVCNGVITYEKGRTMYEGLQVWEE